MTKLNSTQTDLLTAAAASDTGAIAIPDGAKPAAAGLIKRGFAISVAQAEEPNQLVITNAGREAIGAPPASTAPGDRPPGPSKRAAASAAKTKPTEVAGKLGAVVALLRRPGGATIEAMMQATGWQAHSVRGAISGSIKKKRGLTVVSEKTDAGRIYRIPAKAPA